MKDVLRTCEVFRGMDEDTVSRAVAIARRRPYEVGEHPFVLGQQAEHLYVVLEGRLDLCIPISILGTIKEVTVETKGPGCTLGWSAFVKPHRFRLSARVAEPTELAVLARDEVRALLASDERVGTAFMERIGEVIAERLLTVQALWARELQRYLLGEGHVAVGS